MKTLHILLVFSSLKFWFLFTNFDTVVLVNELCDKLTDFEKFNMGLNEKNSLILMVLCISEYKRFPMAKFSSLISFYLY